MEAMGWQDLTVIEEGCEEGFGIVLEADIVAAEGPSHVVGCEDVPPRQYAPYHRIVKSANDLLLAWKDFSLVSKDSLYFST